MSKDNDARVTVGEIRGVYGVKGWVKLFSWTSPRENLLDYPRFLDESGREWHLIEGRVQGKSLVAQLRGVDDRDQAAALNGTKLTIARDELPETADDEYYWSELEGCTVFREDDEVIGKVEYLIETGSNDVLVIRTAKKGEVLVPFIPGSVVKQVDIDAKRIVVDWVDAEHRA